MDNVRMLVRREHEFHGRPAEEGESLNVIVMPVKNAAIKKIVVRMWLDKEALQPFHESEINIAVNPLIVVRHQEIAVSFGQTPDAVIPHAIILGQNDLDRITANAELAGQSLNNVPKPADLCGWSALGRDHCDEHGVLNGLNRVECVKWVQRRNDKTLIGPASSGRSFESEKVKHGFASHIHWVREFRLCERASGEGNGRRTRGREGSFF